MRKIAAFAFLLLFLPVWVVAQIPPVGSLTVGTTAIANGTNGLCLYQNGAKLGEQACGTGTAQNITIGTTTVTGASDGDILTRSSGTLGNVTQVPVANGGTAGATGRVAAANLSMPYVLCHTSTIATHSGDTNETILGWCNVPAGVMGTNGCVQTDVRWDFTAGGSPANWTAIIRIIAGTSNGTTSGTGVLSATITQPQKGVAHYAICNNNNASAQFVYNIANGLGMSTSGYNTSGAINTANAWTISYNATLGNSGDTSAIRGHTDLLIQSAGN